MTSKVEKSIEVEAPLQRVYNQWTQFEQFPQFMGGVEEVKQLSDTSLHWVAKIAGVKREWDAAIVEQVPDRKVAWAATTGATNAGSVYFESLGTNRTGVRLVLEYDPEGFVEKVGDRLNIVSRQAQNDLEKFKEFIESSESETGAWRGTVTRDDTEGEPAGSAGGDTTTIGTQPSESAGATGAGTPTAMTDSPSAPIGGGGVPASDPAHDEAERAT
jgi:carbon monoxide dehydrogenase subunit G